MAARRKKSLPRRSPPRNTSDLGGRVLSLLGGRRRPVLSAAELARKLGGQRGLTKAVRAALRVLERDGSVERVDGGYRAPRRDGLLEGRYRDTRSADPAAPGRPAEETADAGVVIDEAGNVWPVADPADAQPGDTVLIQPLGGSAEGRVEIVQVIQGTRRSWVGIIERGRRGYELVPYRDETAWRMPLATRDLGGARVGEVVEAGAIRGAARSGATRLQVKRRLGLPGDAEADFMAVVWHRRLPVEFGEAALAEARAPAEELAREEIARRLDLRDRDFVTIDPASARDHDDAIYVEALPRGDLRLWVAIADVSHYVPEGSALDREAWLRGNSVYFPARAIPMLPERLSGDLCSLRADVDRLALTVEISFDRAGRVRESRFHEAVIRSRAGLAYEQAARVMDPPPTSGTDGVETLPEAVVEQLRLLGRLTARLSEQRLAGGALDFELPAAEIILDAEGRPIDVVQASRTLAHRAVEEAMLAANREVARKLDAAGEATVFRIHEAPAPKDLDSLRELYESLGLLASKPDAGLGTSEIGSALARVAGRPEARLVNLLTLRAMRQARYCERNFGHFALAFPSYLHFTSPIRRYADLVVHRAVRRLLGREPGAPAQRTPPEEATARMQRLAIRVSSRERLAMAAEREMATLAQCAFMREKIGREYDGVVTGVAEHGLYVTLDDHFVEGLIVVSDLNGYFDFDPQAHALVARRSGERHRLGDRLRVRVERVDQLKGWINFVIPRDRKEKAIEGGRSERRPRRSSAPSRRRGRRSPA